jgi:hypothetical protein
VMMLQVFQACCRFSSTACHSLLQSRRPVGSDFESLSETLF